MFLNGNEEFESRIVSDKVGYAKILVLDAKNYQKLESGTASKWQSSSLLNSSGTFNTDELKNSDQIEDENWSQLDKTIYAYKEFAEMYEKYGIAGNIIYIDGFKCELPDEEYKVETEDKNAEEENSSTVSNKEKPSGKPLTKSDFNVLSSALEDENELIQTKYEKDDEYKLSSKKVTERLNAEIKIKDMASCAIGVSNITFIKEGTVIGRTFTDKEIVEDLRGEKYDDYIKAAEEESSNTSNQSSSSEEPKNKLIGNYLRIIMRDLDDTVVENIENYMKLDEGKGKSKSTLGNIEQFMYWQANEPEGFEFIQADGTESFPLADLGGTGGVKARRDNPSDKYGHDYAIDGLANNDINLCPGIWLGEGSSGLEIFKKVVGDANVYHGRYVTGEQNLEIYIKELEVVKQSVIDKVPVTAEWEEDDTRMFALMDVMYAGTKNFEIGTIYGKLKSGDTNLTKEDFLSNCTNANPFYTQNPTAFTRRRIHDYYMYTEGFFCNDIYSAKDTEVKQRWEFTSETPFQDLMIDKISAKLVDI